MLDLVRKARRCIHAQRTAYVDEITGKTLLAWGYKPGGWFGGSANGRAASHHLRPLLRPAAGGLLFLRTTEPLS
jgi:hypothetical protein